ncbi:MAG: hypothetical protein QG622_155 [Actinomycetota bacterium]|nr:hypothetical protein [Actinomycetota bacterium]
MTTSPRDALDRLVAALEAHYQAVTRRTGEADPAVISAYQTLADAFETYDNALYDTFDEVTPFELVDDSDDDLDDDDEDEDDELDEDDLDDELDDDLDDLEDLDDDLDDEAEEPDDDAAVAHIVAGNGQKRSG